MLELEDEKEKGQRANSKKNHVILGETFVEQRLK